MPHAVVVGAGIAGSAAAVALIGVGLTVEILEAREPEDTAGAFLVIAPNGVNALSAMGLGHVLPAAGGMPLDGIGFVDHRGRKVGRLDGTDDVRRYGASSQLVLRERLRGELLAAAQAAGAVTAHSARVIDVHEGRDSVSAALADGQLRTADLLIGADGVRSAVRTAAFPTARPPAYTGVADCGGWAAVDLPDTSGQRMVFGHRGFFGYVVRDGTAYWFSNVRHADANGLRSVGHGHWLRHLRDRHADDPWPVPTILSATESVAGVWPVYDLPTLETWHSARLCLIGDAAHAASPSAGQGASMALEDAAVLARCCRDASSPSAALPEFEALRKGRAEGVVRLGRRLGSTKQPSVVGARLRNLALPLFLRMGARQTASLYAYRSGLEQTPTAPGRRSLDTNAIQRNRGANDRESNTNDRTE